MKRIDKTGVVHLSIEYSFGWWSYCATTFTLGSTGDVVHHDTVVTCMSCVARLATGKLPEETHQLVRENGVVVRDQNGYYFAVCHKGEKGIDSSFINDKNPSCYVCRKLNEKNNK